MKSDLKLGSLVLECLLSQMLLVLGTQRTLMALEPTKKVRVPIVAKGCHLQDKFLSRKYCLAKNYYEVCTNIKSDQVIQPLV